MMFNEVGSKPGSNLMMYRPPREKEQAHHNQPIARFGLLEVAMSRSEDRMQNRFQAMIYDMVEDIIQREEAKRSMGSVGSGNNVTEDDNDIGTSGVNNENVAPEGNEGRANKRSKRMDDSENVDTTEPDLTGALFEEVKAVRKGFKGVLDARGGGQVSADELAPLVFDKVFGVESGIQDLFTRKELRWSRQRFHGFLCTFALQAKYEISADDIFDRFSELDVTGCLSKQQYMDCWNEIATRSIELPVSRPSRSLPLQCSKRSSMVCQSDTGTKIIQKYRATPPQHHLTPQSLAVARMLEMAMLCAHRIVQHVTAPPNFMEQCISLQQYRSSANKRSGPFKYSLSRLRDWSKKQQLDNPFVPEGIIAETTTGGPPLEPNTQANSTIQQANKLRFLEPRTGATPTKNTRNFKAVKDASDRAKLDVMFRMHNCPGRLLTMFEYDDQQPGNTGNKKRKSRQVLQGVCSRCSGRTSHICALCHLRFCYNPEIPDGVDTIYAKNNASMIRATFVDLSSIVTCTTRSKGTAESKQKVVKGKWACFHFAHEEVWEQNDQARKSQRRLIELSREHHRDLEYW